MTETSVVDQIKQLVELQKIDVEIYNIKVDLKEKPALIEELKQSFESKKAHLHELEENSKIIAVTRKSYELEMKTKEDGIAKANTQLSELKTNKEYTAKISEIESIKADKSCIEEKIIISYDESDSILEKINQEKERVLVQEKEYLSKKKEVEDSLKEMESRVSVLDNQRGELIPQVDETIFKRYERILEHKNGVAIVAVQGASCGGCYMNLNPQVMNDLNMHSELIECEMCSRIIYLEDES